VLLSRGSRGFSLLRMTVLFVFFFVAHDSIVCIFFVMYSVIVTNLRQFAFPKLSMLMKLRVLRSRKWTGVLILVFGTRGNLVCFLGVAVQPKWAIMSLKSLKSVARAEGVRNIMTLGIGVQGNYWNLRSSSSLSSARSWTVEFQTKTKFRKVKFGKVRVRKRHILDASFPR